ncbi:hypothetical protein LDB30_06060 [Acidithiobacillus ferrooxidans]|nr:hypothetical protein LDB30_06060 [Acidithiobacillus ferrooxidans]
MNKLDMQKEIDKLDVVIQDLRQDLDGAIRLRQVWKDRLAECTPSFFEVDAAHWDEISCGGTTPCREQSLPRTASAGRSPCRMA